MPVVSNATPGDFQADGVVVQENLSSPTPSSGGPASGRIGFVGGGNWGKPNTPLGASDSSSIQAVAGSDTTSTNSLVRAALDSTPECTDMVLVRQTDGSDVAASLLLLDTAGSPGTLLDGTARSSGSRPNGSATIRADFQTDPASLSPLYSITVAFPNEKATTYSGIVGYVTAGSGYDAPTFKANALAALNGTDGVHTANPWFTFAAGASVVTPKTGTAFAASGGTDGSSGLTSALLMGTDGDIRTGVYALRGTGIGQVVVAGLIDSSKGAELATFAQSENASPAHIGFGVNMTDDEIIAAKQANNLYNENLSTDVDWDYVSDSISGKNLLVPPMGKIAGIIASLRSDQDPSNKPKTGTQGDVYATTVTAAGGQGLSKPQKGKRQQNGLLYLSNQMPRGGNLLGLPHGMSADAKTPISDVRMAQEIAAALDSGGILGQFVGESQTPDGNDDTRLDAVAALKSYFNGQIKPIRRIAGYDVVLDTSNNTPTSIADGFLIAQINVKTLAGIRWVFAIVQVGTTVQLAVSKA